jgi:hypothetical protein
MNNDLNELADVPEDEVALGETLCASRTKVLRVCSCKRVRRVPSASGRRRRCCKASLAIMSILSTLSLAAQGLKAQRLTIQTTGSPRI